MASTTIAYANSMLCATLVSSIAAQLNKMG